jgi:hypothetical protein
MITVASFFAPRPEHPFYQDYTPYLNLLRESCVRYGARHVVLTDDPSVGDDAYVTELPRSLMKAVLAAQFAYLADPANAFTPTLLVGADCVLANDPEVFLKQDADLVITVGDFADCRMNTGAIFVPKPCQVAEIWAEALAHVGDDWGDDQTSLLRAIEQRPTHGLWSAKVVELPVDPYNLAPEYPGDDCKRGVVLHFRGNRKRWMADYCREWLGIGPGVELDMACNTPDVIMRANVDASHARGLPVLGEQLEAHDGHAVLCGGGPSLESTLHEIRWRESVGQTVFGLNGAASWLLDRGVACIGVMMDPRASNAVFIDPRCPWFIASQCAPEVFDRADELGIEVHLWHYLHSAEHLDVPRMGGGVTIGLTSMALAYVMGFRQLHLYGYDSSARDDGENHAYGQAESGTDAMRVEAWSGDRQFVTSPAMFAQARAFPNWAATLANAGTVITVHGDGLLPSLARHMHAATLLQGEGLAA